MHSNLWLERLTGWGAAGVAVLPDAAIAEMFDYPPGSMGRGMPFVTWLYSVLPVLGIILIGAGVMVVVIRFRHRTGNGQRRKVNDADRSSMTD